MSTLLAVMAGTAILLKSRSDHFLPPSKNPRKRLTLSMPRGSVQMSDVAFLTCLPSDPCPHAAPRGSHAMLSHLWPSRHLELAPLPSLPTSHQPPVLRLSVTFSWRPSLCTPPAPRSPAALRGFPLTRPLAGAAWVTLPLQQRCSRLPRSHIQVWSSFFFSFI